MDTCVYIYIDMYAPNGINREAMLISTTLRTRCNHVTTALVQLLVELFAR